MDRVKLLSWIKQYRYVLLVLLAGLIFMLLPEKAPETTEPMPTEVVQREDMETRLEQILSRIRGAGEVAVMLTESAGEEIVYQSDGEGADTVLITGADRSEQGLVRTRQPPTYRGVIVVCAGADSAAIRLAIVDAVAVVTGLGADKITVLSMK